jgi:hypothetical protein
MGNQTLQLLIEHLAEKLTEHTDFTVVGPAASHVSWSQATYMIRVDWSSDHGALGWHGA